MLGLEYGRVRLAPSHPQWARAFVEERARLADALSNVPCQIEHVGSSAVPGLPAKPIIDIAVGVSDDASVPLAISAIQAIGYVYRCDAGADGGHVLVRESQPLVRTHHVHVVGLGGSAWDAYIALREHLRRSAAARDAYAAEKRMLSERHPDDHRAYTRAKSDIVRTLLAEARRPRARSAGLRVHDDRE